MAGAACSKQFAANIAVCNEKEQRIENCPVEALMLRPIFYFYACSRRSQCTSGQRGDDESQISQPPRIRVKPRPIWNIINISNHTHSMSLGTSLYSGRFEIIWRRKN